MKINASHIAKLANLPLSDTEKKEFEPQLEETLEYIDTLNKIDTANTDPTSQVTGLENVTREDVPLGSFTQDQALSNSKATHNGLFKVKAILDND